MAIYYDPAAGALPDGTNHVFIHIGHSGWQDVISPDPQMIHIPGTDYWKYTYSISPTATSVDFVFTDGAGSWDNNGGQDWHVPVIGGSSSWTMDGSLDPGAQQIAISGGAALWVDWDSPYLYVATQAASPGSDRFVFVADTPGVLVDAPWAKAGQVASWDAYLANEGENGYHSWFDATGSRDAAAGTYLEGFLNLEEELGALPETVHLAVGIYQTSDGGALTGQVPSGNGDGEIQSDEYAVFDIPLTRATYPESLQGPSPVTLRAFPVPSRGTTAFEIRGADSVLDLGIYDVRGRLVRAYRTAAAGDLFVFHWDGNNTDGHAVPTGIYWARAKSFDRTVTHKIVLIR